MFPIEQQIHKNLRFNVIVGLVDGSFFGLAMGFGSFSTILPLFVSHLTTSAILIGLVPAIHAVGWLSPQLLTAGRVARLRRFKPTVVLMTIHERLPFIGLMIVALLIPHIGVTAALVITFLLLTWQGLGSGFTANPWQSMIAKIIPSDLRGTFFGGQAAAANVLTSLGAIGVGYVLEIGGFPYGFALSFLLTAACMALSWIFLNRTREPESPEVVDQSHPATTLRGTWGILRRDTNFSWFLVTRILALLATMGFSFYIVYALRRFNMDVVTAGFLTATLTISQTVANLGMGWLGDRVGHRLMLIIGALALTLSSLLAWGAPSLDWFYLIFILEGLANVAIWTISMAITVQFGSEVERPTYIGLSNTLVAPFSIIAPILGGWLVDAVSYQAMFMLAAALGFVTAVVLTFLVKNPRRPAQEQAQLA
ncbi:MAG: MFS transporter [Anaerolineales bacterium]